MINWINKKENQWYDDGIKIIEKILQDDEEFNSIDYNVTLVHNMDELETLYEIVLEPEDDINDEVVSFEMYPHAGEHFLTTSNTAIYLNVINKRYDLMIEKEYDDNYIERRYQFKNLCFIGAVLHEMRHRYQKVKMADWYNINRVEVPLGDFKCYEISIIEEDARKFEKDKMNEYHDYIANIIKFYKWKK